MPPMNNIRYTFPLLFHQNRLYAIGGRTYGKGSDPKTFRDQCEYFDLNLKTWNNLPSLNLGRVTHSAFVYGN